MAQWIRYPATLQRQSLTSRYTDESFSFYLNAGTALEIFLPLKVDHRLVLRGHLGEQSIRRLTCKHPCSSTSILEPASSAMLEPRSIDTWRRALIEKVSTCQFGGVFIGPTQPNISEKIFRFIQLILIRSAGFSKTQPSAGVADSSVSRQSDYRLEGDLILPKCRG